ncbi:acylphosphatase [Marinobacter sp.]|uniref:acylphosphatase n=1 Tax=Marinobacter sp. TaxID=50741 RepID=UPI0034A14BE0
MPQKRWTMLISGKVQGVSYRASTQQIAKQLGVTGYARNLPDGRVEVVAQGAVENLQAFRIWCAKGPSAAEVTGITVSEDDAENEEFRDFLTQ